ncbi:MAG TPA: molybdenum cofactor guanylyltransferase [Fimbriimonadaceae bacterium]|nr:molybdenum cofactor guanylyltransferase [Fimbriimonadaceae bacterium]
MKTEAVLLTGGASRRMGQDKATLTVDGVSLAARILAELDSVRAHTTVLGQRPIEGYAFLPDREPGGGPLQALAQFSPAADSVFVVSCDVPLFSGKVVPLFAGMLAGHDAVVPEIDGYRQTLCALYAAPAFQHFADAAEDPDRRSMKAATDSLDALVLDEAALTAQGIDPLSLRNANTPEELASLLQEARSGR